MGVKITLLRTTGMTPAVRLFEGATEWVFADDHPGGTLCIVKQKTADATASSDYGARITIAEFPAGGIESVEFYNKEIV